jgi:hypothetical protein
MREAIFFTSLSGLADRVTRSGDFSPNGRLFAFGQLLENYRSSPHFFRHFVQWLSLCINLEKKWAGLHFGRIFSQTHLVTLLAALIACVRRAGGGANWSAPKIQGHLK